MTLRPVPTPSVAPTRGQPTWFAGAARFAADLTHRRMDRYVRELMSPAYPSAGSGDARRFTLAEIRALALLGECSEMGIHGEYLRAIAQTITQLRDEQWHEDWLFVYRESDYIGPLITNSPEMPMAVKRKPAWTFPLSDITESVENRLKAWGEKGTAR